MDSLDFKSLRRIGKERERSGITSQTLVQSKMWRTQAKLLANMINCAIENVGLKVNPSAQFVGSLVISQDIEMETKECRR